MQILVVDDSATQRSLIKVFLSGQNLKFLEAGNGIDALKVVRSCTLLDLIVTDLNMPEMDGVAFIRRLRQSVDTRLRRVPIIVLTGERSQAWFDQATVAGASAFCRKPVSKSDLLALVSEHLRLASTPPPADPQVER